MNCTSSLTKKALLLYMSFTLVTLANANCSDGNESFTFIGPLGNSITRDCTWVKSGTKGLTETRCASYAEARATCPQTCGECSNVPSDAPSVSSEPTWAPCFDVEGEVLFERNDAPGQYLAQDCAWVADKESRCTRFKEAAEFCPKTCKLCRTEFPSMVPSVSAAPSDVPSDSPSDFPSGLPSELLSDLPSGVPSALPSEVPSALPSEVPSEFPSAIPSDVPSSFPSDVPSELPSVLPSNVPSALLSEAPSALLSEVPSEFPSTIPSDVPSSFPSELPSDLPSELPSELPSDLPSVTPTYILSDVPSVDPSTTLSATPSAFISPEPSAIPTTDTSSAPSMCADVTGNFTVYRVDGLGVWYYGCDWVGEDPSKLTDRCSRYNTTALNCPQTCGDCPTRMPSDVPSDSPSVSGAPSDVPSEFPSAVPSVEPSEILTSAPSTIPSISSCEDNTEIFKVYRVDGLGVWNYDCAWVGEDPSKLADRCSRYNTTAANCPVTCGTCIPTLEPSVSSVPSEAPSEILSGAPSAEPSVIISPIPSAIPTPGPCEDTTGTFKVYRVDGGGLAPWIRDCAWVSDVPSKLADRCSRYNTTALNCPDTCGLC